MDAPDVPEVQSVLAAALVAIHISRKVADAQVSQVFESSSVHVCLLISCLQAIVLSSCAQSLQSPCCCMSPMPGLQNSL